MDEGKKGSSAEGRPEGGCSEAGRGPARREGRSWPAGSPASAAAASSGKGGKVTLSSPIIVKALAEAVGKKPNEVIADLIKLGELAGLNQAVSEANAKKLCAGYGYELVIGAPPPKPAAPALR